MRPRFIATALCVTLCVLFVAIAVGMSGCQSTLAVQQQCLPMRVYTPQEQAKLREELKGAGPTTRQFVADYLTMRDENRACQAASRG